MPCLKSLGSNYSIGSDTRTIHINSPKCMRLMYMSNVQGRYAKLKSREKTTPRKPPLTYSSFTPTILPPSSPPLLPKPTIKLLLPKLPINLIMRLAHPPPKLLPTLQFGLIPSTRMRHPCLEIIRTYPARVQLREEL